MTRRQANLVQQGHTILGESPLWHAREGALYWIDILRPAIYRFVPGQGLTGYWPMPSPIGAMAFCGDAQLIVALEKEAVCLFDPLTGHLKPFADPLDACGPSQIPGRYNDGRVDALGNFWLGWLTHDRQRPGALFRIEPDQKARVVLDDITAPNGLGWSPDTQTMYVTDSHINTIWAYTCDLKTGALHTRRTLAIQDRALGIFDGLSVDVEGNIWTALYGGNAVLQIAPDGRRLSKIDLPALLVTSCTFGGGDLKTLMITTAIRDQNRDELKNQPLAGSLFSAQLEIAGLPENRFKPASALQGPGGRIV